MPSICTYIDGDTQTMVQRCVDGRCPIGARVRSPILGGPASVVLDGCIVFLWTYLGESLVLGSYPFRLGMIMPLLIGLGATALAFPFGLNRHLCASYGRYRRARSIIENRPPAVPGSHLLIGGCGCQDLAFSEPRSSDGHADRQPAGAEPTGEAKSRQAIHIELVGVSDGHPLLRR